MQQGAERPDSLCWDTEALPEFVVEMLRERFSTTFRLVMNHPLVVNHQILHIPPKFIYFIRLYLPHFYGFFANSSHILNLNNGRCDCASNYASKRAQSAPNRC